MKKVLFSISLISLGLNVLAQQKKDSFRNIEPDSLIIQSLGEVIIIGNPAINFKKENKALGSLDSYLEKSNSINMIRRGAYAWEPMLNGMQTERSVITIDGMRIFHACTDKMDPLTSYVDNTNLALVKVKDGQMGATYGGTIAGSINLITRKIGFFPQKKFGGTAFSGIESNNKQQIYGTTLNYTSPRYFAGIDFTYRQADDYNAGHRKGQSSKVKFSQFTKYNISATSGYKLNNKQEIESSIIFDNASDIGYPALSMDVSLARAIITSLQYQHKNISKHLKRWETKIYFNTIKHVMDDSHRPAVPMHMDMPGWSKTAGFYSTLLGYYGKHSLSATLSGYQNNSLAEMKMYPNDPNENKMFMLTWPDVNTLYGGLNLEDNISIGDHVSLNLQGGIGIHNNAIKSHLGLNSLRIFYPELKATKTRVIKNVSSELSYQHNHLLYQLAIGYGDRAPSISEGYGYYLYNINDNYDYIGNPNLKNEKSFNINTSAGYSVDKFSVKASVNYFYILDYIIGKPKAGIPPMTPLANGIKVYAQFSYASLFNSSLTMKYNLSEHWKFSADASYRYGQGAEHTVLPLIQPFIYKLSARYDINHFFAEATVKGSTKNRNSIEFNETQKPAYTIMHIALSKEFSINNTHLTVKLGVENLFDKYYSTFDDWFGIPEMGRNIYTNVIFKF